MFKSAVFLFVINSSSNNVRLVNGAKKAKVSNNYAKGLRASITNKIEKLPLNLIPSYLL